MAGMGPAPKPKGQQRHRIAQPAMVQLPAEGRSGPVPDFTLPEATDEELALWADLWRLPQACVWEKQGSHREVAQYVRWKVKAESGDLKAAPEARQMSDRLGLTPLAMLRLRWEIVSDELGQARESKSELPKLTAADFEVA